MIQEENHNVEKQRSKAINWNQWTILNESINHIGFYTPWLFLNYS